VVRAIALQAAHLLAAQEHARAGWIGYVEREPFTGAGRHAVHDQFVAVDRGGHGGFLVCTRQIE
jgi:hypothetical protein